MEPGSLQDQGRGVLLGQRLGELVRSTSFANNTGIGDGPLRITLSIGVSAVSDAIPDEAAFLKTTDDALYMAKRGGRDQVQVLTRCCL